MVLTSSEIFTRPPENLDKRASVVGNIPRITKIGNRAEVAAM